MSNLLDWTLDVREVGRDGRAVAYTATSGQRDQIAEALDLEACRALSLSARIRPLAKSRVLVEGTLRADVVQRCVVTLEPVAAAIEHPFAVEFWPPADIEAGSSPSFDALSGEDPEPIEDGAVALGRLAYELLAAALDPYPRKPGAELPAPATGEGEPAVDPASPFAKLAKLRPGGAKA